VFFRLILHRYRGTFGIHLKSLSPKDFSLLVCGLPVRAGFCRWSDYHSMDIDVFCDILSSMELTRNFEGLGL
jgi:hypothetical protein